MKWEAVPIKKIKPNPDNPRTIKDENFHRLVQSIRDFPQMLEIRPVVVNSDMMVIGGNMRLRACKEAGIKKVPIIHAGSLTPEQQREFIIKDNVTGGEWNWETLSTDWDVAELADWGLNVPEFEEQDFSDKNQEVDPNEFSDMLTMKLEYNETDYHRVKDALLLIAGTPEAAVFKLLNLSDD